ncbi:MAG: transporter substrate-binding domain-containing protein, partial [Thiotrichaceae bacterium]|nr:transporter substrate-binding domain-containing protein [Thiotrichaceae bacterium]
MINSIFFTFIQRVLSILPLLYISLCQASLEQASPLPKLTAREQAWMNTHPHVRVGGSLDWTPFNFVNASGQYSGIANDYLQLISQKTGLNFTPSISQWSDNLEKIRHNKIDLLPAVYFTEERSQYLTYSPPYFEVLDYFFIRDDLNAKTLADLNGKRVAIPESYAHIKLIKKHFPKIKIVIVNTFGDAIDAVLENRADLLYDTYGALSYTLEKEGINTIIPFKSTRKLGKNSIHIVTRKDNPALSAIIQKGLNAITAKEKRNIYNKWLGSTAKSNLHLKLTEQESNWITAHPVIRFTGDPS